MASTSCRLATLRSSGDSELDAVCVGVSGKVGGSTGLGVTASFVSLLPLRRLTPDRIAALRLTLPVLSLWRGTRPTVTLGLSEEPSSLISPLLLSPPVLGKVMDEDELRVWRQVSRSWVLPARPRSLRDGICVSL